MAIKPAKSKQVRLLLDEDTFMRLLAIQYDMDAANKGAVFAQMFIVFEALIRTAKSPGATYSFQNAAGEPLGSGLVADLLK
jgi:hypothetical protein